MTQVTQISIGRFHHFHLARQLERFGLLKEIWTGYPRFKLRDEQGIPARKIRTFPWLQTPYMAMGRLPTGLHLDTVSQELAYWAHTILDRRVAAAIHEPTILFALSGSGLAAGAKAQRLGGKHVCDRGSSHIRFQDRILHEEHARWGLDFEGIDPRMIAREEAEYAQADVITVPSAFAERSFVEMGLPPGRLRRVPYGARLERFFPQGTPDLCHFTVLFVGQVSLRKGVPYLLNGFARLRHDRKRMWVVGSMQHDMRLLLARLPTEGVEFLGAVPNAHLPMLYSRADAFVLPSIEEGLAYVMGEALACGCPVIASSNTGAEDLFTDGQEGFIVPPRDPAAIAHALEKIADSKGALRPRARTRVEGSGGWDRYGERMRDVLGEVAGASQGRLGCC